MIKRSISGDVPTVSDEGSGSGGFAGAPVSPVVFGAGLGVAFGDVALAVLVPAPARVLAFAAAGLAWAEGNS